MADEVEVVLSPGEAARRLGVSPSGLRRLAGAYAEVHGELPKDSSGTSRLWSAAAVERLERARALLAAGQARSIRDALVAVEHGAAPRVEIAAQEGHVAAALGMVAAQLEALQDSNRRLEAEVRALRSEVATLKALERAQPGPSGPSSLPAPERPQEVEGRRGGRPSRRRSGGLLRWLERRLKGGRG